MTTGLFAAVTGMLTHQRKIDVIADNIANVSTTGFRGQRAQFQTLFSQSLQGPRGPQANYGGTNPMQVGLGVMVASIDTNYGQGALTTTGVATDLAIQGSGFFVLNDGRGNLTYTRDGSFGVNSLGFLIEPATGQFVQGYMANANVVIDVEQGFTNLSIPLGGGSIVQATSTAVFAGNLNSDTVEYDAGPPEVGVVYRTIRVYDSLGTVRDIQVEFRKDAAANEWTWVALSDQADGAPPAVQVGTGTLTFDSDGFLTGGSPGTISVSFPAGDPALPTIPFEFEMDFSEMTQLAGESDVALIQQDGFPRGVLESFDFGRDGVINAVYSNGMTRVIGQVALATFQNNGGLVRVGSNQFRETPSSGAAQIGIPNTGGRGIVSGGVLENSNVDLGREFSNMIITQRGFQANTRTITTVDTMLQETVNLIR